MTPKLTNELVKAVEDQCGKPLKVVNPATQNVYVIITDEQFERVRSLFEQGEFDIRDTYVAQETAVGKAGWDDPALDVYNDHDASRQQS